jgi:hypothetical protein
VERPAASLVRPDEEDQRKAIDGLVLLTRRHPCQVFDRGRTGFGKLWEFSLDCRVWHALCSDVGMSAPGRAAVVLNAARIGQRAMRPPEQELVEPAPEHRCSGVGNHGR